MSAIYYIFLYIRINKNPIFPPQPFLYRISFDSKIENLYMYGFKIQIWIQPHI
jgi:hypothetical protein